MDVNITVIAPFTVYYVSEAGLIAKVEDGDAANFATALNIKDRTPYVPGTEIKIFDNSLNRWIK